MATQVSCASKPHGESSPPTPALPSGEYWIVSAKGQPVVEQGQASLAFDATGQVSGNASVNRFSESSTIAGLALSFSPLATTRMAGPPALSQQEGRVLTALTETRSYSFGAAGDLSLMNEAGQEVLRARRQQLLEMDGEPGSSLEVTVHYLERVALQPGHNLVIELQDVSRADAPAITLARHEMEISGQVPLSFDLAYSPQEIRARGRYVVRAMLFDRKGTLTWTTTSAYPVLTGGAPATSVVVELEAVQ